MIDLQNIKHKILDIDNFQIPKGYTCIIGENGSGKSTLLNLLSGMDLSEKGSVYVNRRRIRDINVGYVPECPERQIIFELVFDEIISPLRFSFVISDEASEKTMAISKLLGITHLLDKKTFALSGGEKAFVSLAVAIVSSPELLILDEPDSHLDFDTAGKLMSVLKKSGTDYVIHCTQNMEIAKTADFLIYMEKGRIKFSGHPETVFKNLKNTNFFPVMWRLEEIVG